MLEHEEQKNTAQQSAPPANANASEAENERVTAEEFAAAINSLDQRRASEAAHQASTVAVGQTLRELNIDATPDEILAEVRAQRARAAAAQKAKTDVKTRAEQTVTTAWTYASAAYKTLRQHIEEAQRQAATNQTVQPIAPVQRPTRYGSQRARGGIGGLIGTIFVFWFMWQFMSGHLGGFPFNILRHAPMTPGVIRPLDQVPDGETVYCDTNQVVNILNSGGTVSGAKTASTMTNQMPNSWPIFRHGGKVYLSGYTLPTSIPVLDSGPVNIFNDDNSGDLEGNSDDTVTVPLSGADLDRETQHDSWSELTVNHIKTDPLTQDSHE